MESSTLARPRSAADRPERPALTVRRLDLRLEEQEVPRAYYANDVHLTTMWSALSVLFPEGERMFVDSVRHYRDDIRDPRLSREITAFIGQEAMHAKEHDALTRVLFAQGSRVARATDRRLRRGLGLVRRVLSPKSLLAATCALEHFTALLAEQLLAREDVRADLHPSMRGLWSWHALEESEHKSVAFDVYRAAGGGTLRRIGIMLLTTFAFLFVTALVYFAMLREQKALLHGRGLLRAAMHFWGPSGFFTSLIPAYFSYYRPSFHPEDRDTSGLVAMFQERLFGAGGVYSRPGQHASREAALPVHGDPAVVGV